MSYFRRPGAELDAGADPDELLGHEPGADPRSSRATFTELTHRVSRWFQGLDVDDPDGDTSEWDPFDLADSEPEPASAEQTGFDRPEFRPEPRSRADADGGDDVAPQFPLVTFGYNRMVVDEHIAALEHQLEERDRELAELRERHVPPMSITEEIERIGEQTASILVVAHDQAHETTRRAEEQAERCIADAAANAVAITSEAKERLRELDDETDAVWRERERLLDDTRTVSVRLATLVDEAVSRFPADGERPTAAAVIGSPLAMGAAPEMPYAQAEVADPVPPPAPDAGLTPADDGPAAA